MEEYPLPPGFTVEKMRQAVRAFESVLGAGKVFFEDLDRLSYLDKFAIHDGTHQPAGAVGPTASRKCRR